MHIFLEKYNWLQLTQEETDNMNSPLFIKETEFILKPFPQRKLTG